MFANYIPKNDNGEIMWNINPSEFHDHWTINLHQAVNDGDINMYLELILSFCQIKNLCPPFLLHSTC